MSTQGVGSGSAGLTRSDRTVESKVTADSSFENRQSFWAWATLKDRAIADFNFYLKVLMVVFILSLSLEAWLITVVFSKKIISIVLQVLIIFGLIHTFLNIIAVKILQSRLSLNACVFSCINTFIVLAIYCAQILVGETYYKTSQIEFRIVFAVNILQIIAGFGSMMVMYRFWEYLMYNHDFTENNSEEASGRSSRMASLMDEEARNPVAFEGKRLTDALLLQE